MYPYVQQNAIPDRNLLHCSAMSLSELQHHPVEDGNENQSLEEQKLEESMEKQKPKAKKVKKKTRKGLPTAFFLFLFFHCYRNIYP